MVWATPVGMSEPVLAFVATERLFTWGFKVREWKPIGSRQGQVWVEPCSWWNGVMDHFISVCFLSGAT